MDRLPSMQTLRAFEAAARLGSYTGAATELGLTHGAISHRIRELEERFGTRLFRRSGRRMVPTREAVTLLAQVGESLAGLQRVFPAGGAASRLVVSVHPSLATRWLVPRIGDFIARHPDLELELRSTADLGEFLDAGVDLAIRYGAGDWPGATDEALSGEVLFPVCSPAYRERHKIERPDDLARCTLLRHAWQTWGAWLRDAKLGLAEPKQGLILSDGAMLLEAASAGCGVALARRLFALDDLASGRLVRLFATETVDTYAYRVAWRQGTTPSKAARLFIAWLREALFPAQAGIQTDLSSHKLDPRFRGE